MRDLHVSVDIWKVAILAAISSPLSACGGAAAVDVGEAGASGRGLSGQGGSRAHSGQAGSGRPAGTGGGHAAGGAAGSSSKLFACVSAGEYAHPGSGYESCRDGFVHRQFERECRSVLPRRSGSADAGADASPDASSTLSNPYALCTSDAECTAAAHGHCDYGVGGALGPSCFYGCVRDAECKSDEVCLCGEEIGRCVLAACKTDAECVGDALCIANVDKDCGVSNEFTCQSTADECAGAAQCPASSSCNPGPNGRVCASTCVYGRPFLVQKCARTAPVRASEDWVIRGPLPEPELLPAGAARVAEHWTRVALMEHASIAAFARFALELLSLGAPPELLEATHTALADETRHARVAFSLASRFAGQPVGPGPLDLAGVFADAGLEAIVTVAVLECCIGETIASLEAAEAHALASDADAKAALGMIAADERRHAELGWRFVGWALSQHGPRLSSVVAQAFEDGIRQLLPSNENNAADLEAYGLLGSATSQWLRERAIAEVLLPCRDRLLGNAARGHVSRTEPPLQSSVPIET
jgi:hypothetical protein